MTHSWLLVLAYASTCALWWALSRVLPLWPPVAAPRFGRPWRELGIALLAVFGVLILGQLWQRGIRLEASGWLGTVAESVNQMIIFAPVVLVPIVRRHGWASAWIRLDRLPARIAVGIGLALVALFLYSSLEVGAPGFLATLREVYSPSRAHYAVQVLLEDIGIAIVFVRLAAAVGTKGAILGVAALFALAHVPAIITRGGDPSELIGLFRDFGLGVLVLGTVRRSADIAWFWPVHYSLDMTQFINRPV